MMASDRPSIASVVNAAARGEKFDDALKKPEVDDAPS